MIPAAPVRQSGTGVASSLHRAERALLRGVPLRRLGLDEHEQAALVIASSRFGTEERFAAAALLARERFKWAHRLVDPNPSDERPMLEVEMGLIDVLQSAWTCWAVWPSGSVGRPTYATWRPAHASWSDLWEHVEWHLRRTLVRPYEADAVTHWNGDEPLGDGVAAFDSYFGDEPDEAPRDAWGFRHPAHALRGASQLSRDTLAQADLRAIRKQIHETGYAQRWEHSAWDSKPGSGTWTQKDSSALSVDWNESKLSSRQGIPATKQ